jgi:hypothetical protein
MTMRELIGEMRMNTRRINDTASAIIAAAEALPPAPGEMATMDKVAMGVAAHGPCYSDGLYLIGCEKAEDVVGEPEVAMVQKAEFGTGFTYAEGVVGLKLTMNVGTGMTFAGACLFSMQDIQHLFNEANACNLNDLVGLPVLLYGGHCPTAFRVHTNLLGRG